MTGSAEVANDAALQSWRSGLPGRTEDGQIDAPDRDIRFGLIVAGLFFVLFLGWAAFAPMDSAAFAQGQLVVSGQRQIVQHRDGGVVSAIHVKEGQRVAQGQVLIELADAGVRAQERALGSQLASRQAQRARLQAEQSGAAAIRWPAEWANRADPAIAAEMRIQQSEFAARRSLLSAQHRVLGQQAAQALEGAVGFGYQMVSASEQERLIEAELAILKEVAAKGFVSMTRIRALERAKADLQGQRGQYQSSVAGARAEAGANRLRQIEAEKAYRERASAELRDVEFSLGEVAPKYRAARDQLDRLQIRSPTSGTLMSLSIATVGGVIAPGQTLMEIVPDRADLLIGARIATTDADDLAIGQEAQVRFSGLHDRALPTLHGTLIRLSADAVVDDKTGIAFYTADIRVPASQIALIKRVRGRDFRLRAGAPAEVLIPLKKRTALQYAFEPLTETMWRAFREQ